MKRILASIFVFCFAFLAFAQDAPIFTMQTEAGSPSIEHTRSTRENRDYEFLEQYTDPGAVIYHEGVFHMFRNGFNGWPAPVWIHHMVSEDGINWTQPSQAPILLSEDVPFTTLAALASSVIVEEDGTWVLYFYTWNADNRSEIGRATADNPDGEWTVDPEAVLTVGAAEAWDSHSVLSPQVLKTDTGYLMYYDGADANSRQIGLATSEDGITWEKSEANPILVAEETWEGTTVHQGRTVQTAEGYLMAYRSFTGQRAEMRLGFARSEDGISWTRIGTEPFITVEMLSGFTAFWFTAMEEVDGTIYLYLELTPRSNTTDIYTFTAALEDVLGD